MNKIILSVTRNLFLDKGCLLGSTLGNMNMHCRVWSCNVRHAMQESILSTVIHVTSHLELSNKFCGSFASLQISSPPALGGLVSKDP